MDAVFAKALTANQADRAADRVWLDHRGTPIGYWTEGQIETALTEKLRECVMIAAAARGRGAVEEYHYHALLHGLDASADAFLDLIGAGHIMVELRMHISPDGSPRNAGTAFRVRQNRLPDLYRVVRQLRG